MILVPDYEQGKSYYIPWLHSVGCQEVCIRCNKCVKVVTLKSSSSMALQLW